MGNLKPENMYIPYCKAFLFPIFFLCVLTEINGQCTFPPPIACGDDMIANFNLIDGAQSFCEGQLNTFAVTDVTLNGMPATPSFIFVDWDGGIDCEGDTAEIDVMDMGAFNHEFSFEDEEVVDFADMTCLSDNPRVVNPRIYIEVSCDAGANVSGFTDLGEFFVYLRPRINFTLPDTACVDELVMSTHEVCYGDIDSYTWEWENGQVTMDSTHSYTEAGIYEVVFCTSYEGTLCDDQICDTQTITIISRPDAEIGLPLLLGDDGIGCEGEYTFTNESETGPDIITDFYEWIVYNGSGNIIYGPEVSFDESDFQYDFNNPGDYEVWLVGNSVACDTVLSVGAFTIENAPSAAIIPVNPICWSDFNGYTPAVLYTDQQLVTNYEWTFPTGTPSTSSDAVPTNIDFPTGVHDFSLVLSSDCGTTPPVFGSITIVDPNPPTFPPIDNPYCQSNDTIDITPSIPGGFWAFHPAIMGDTAFVLSLANEGDNNIVYSLGGCHDPSILTISIYPETPVTVTDPTLTICEDEEIVTLSATPLGGAWSGVGISSNGDFDAAIVGPDNTEEMAYTFVDVNGCENTGISTITIEALPVAELDSDTLFFCESANPLNLSIEADIDLPAGYSNEWIGNCITNAIDGTFIPNCLGVGNHTIEYVLFTSNNCSDTTELIVTIIPFMPAVAMNDFSECVEDGNMVILTATPLGGAWSGTNVSPEGIITLDNSMNGSYTYTYTVFPNTNCEDSDEVEVNFINLSNITAPDFDFCQTEGIVQLADGNPSGGYWIFDNNIIPNNEIDIENDFPPGYYTLTYNIESVATNALCESAIDVILFVDSLPTIDVIVPNEVCINEQDTVINNTLETYPGWNWDFGDGTTSNDIAPIITYTSTGDYTITLTIQDTVCTQVFTFPIHVSAPPPPLSFDLTLSALDSCETLTASLVNTSTPNPDIPDVVYIWDYGNGLTDTTYTVVEEPMMMDYEAFDDDTTYYVSLTAISSCGEASEIGLDSIYVKPEPISGFGAQFEFYCSGDTVIYINSTVGNPDSTIVYLENSDGIDTIINHPSDTLKYVYIVGEETDTFYTTFISINDCGEDIVRDTVVVGPVDVVAGFTTSDDGIFCVGSLACVENNATPEIDVWYDMGDGTIIYASDTCHIYQTAGTYTITQYAEDPCGGVAFFETEIEVLPSPTISFTHEPNVCQGDTVAFVAVADTVVSSLLWEFGDGNTSALLSPNHVYEVAGTYTITLTVMDVQMCPTTVSSNITILPLLSPSFMFTDSLCLGEMTTLDNTTIGSVGSCLWMIDNDVSIADCNTTHIFDEIGIHTVELLVTDANGCQSTLDTAIYVRPSPVANFNYTIIESCHPGELAFYNTSTDYNTAIWNFGDGETSNVLDTVYHEYATHGTYTVTLVTSYDGICFDSISQDIEIFETPIAQITLPLSSGCEPLLIIATNGSTGNNLLSEWQTSNGITSYDDDFQYQYLADNPETIHDVQLVVEDSITGCRDTTNVEITVFDSLSMNLQILEEINCNNDITGSITAEILGGNPNYQYQWSNSEVVDTINQLSAGLYTLTVTDANACTAIDTISLLEPTTISLNATLEDVNCIGDNNGNITLSPTGGTAPYTYLWSQGETGISINNLSIGNYTVTLTDSGGCSLTETFTIATANALPIADISLSANSGCEPLEIEITSNSQGNNLIYQWDAGNGDLDNNASFSTIYYANNPQSNYEINLLVIDNLTGCESTAFTEIIVFDSLEIETQVQDASCYAYNDGIITTSLTGGTQPYDYDWSLSISNNDTLIAAAGNYTLTITDTNGCLITTNATIQEPDSITIILEDDGDATCYGIGDGFIDVVATGGTMPDGFDYEYTWNDVNNTQSDILDDVSSGTYTVLVTDTRSCTQSASYTVSDGYLINVQDTVRNIQCHDDANGAIVIQSVEGGIPRFEAYLSGMTNDTLYSDTGVFQFDSLAAGDYVLFIEDDNGCVFEKNYEVDDWNPVIVTAVAESASIYLCDSTILQALATGSGLTYEWSPPVNLVCDTCQNTLIYPTNDTEYTILVTDENGCTATSNIEIEVIEDKEIWLPNAFTPDDNGLNEIFRIRTESELIDRVEFFRIFDEVGELIYEIEDFNPLDDPWLGWDGHFKGAPLDSGSYTYSIVVHFCDGEEVTKTGVVVLLK